MHPSSCPQQLRGSTHLAKRCLHALLGQGNEAPKTNEGPQKGEQNQVRHTPGAGSGEPHGSAAGCTVHFPAPWVHWSSGLVQESQILYIHEQNSPEKSCLHSPPSTRISFLTAPLCERDGGVVAPHASADHPTTASGGRPLPHSSSSWSKLKGTRAPPRHPHGTGPEQTCWALFHALIA